MSAYHLFAGEVRYEGAAGGMEEYVGVFDTLQAAYDAIKPIRSQYYDEKWANVAQLIEGKLVKVATLENQTRMNDAQTRRAISYGWQTNNGFVEMEIIFEQLVPLPTPEIRAPSTMRFTGIWATHEWQRGDPF